MTLAALTTNQEWNSRVVTTDRGECAAEAIAEFDKLWNSEHTKALEDFIEIYETKYRLVKEQRRIAAQNQPIVSLDQYWLQPNRMQAAKWLSIEELEGVDWLPADFGLVEEIKRKYE